MIDRQAGAASADPIILFQVQLDGHGGLSSARSENGGEEHSFLWTHLDLEGTEASEWLEEQFGVDTLICDVLTAEDTRPRSLRHRDGLMLTVRGFNMSPDADADDLVSLRVWIDARQVVTLRHRRSLAPQDVLEDLERGRGPKTAGEFLVALNAALASRMAEGVHELEDRSDILEEEVLDANPTLFRARLSALRRELIGVRRHLAPQREALNRVLSAEDLSWLGTQERSQLREVVNQTTRCVEELDTARERAAITQEELNARISDQMNTRMYALSVTAAIFLPLGLLTGLLGINVGGIPGAENKSAFAAVCVFLVVIAGFQIALYRKLRWL